MKKKQIALNKLFNFSIIVGLLLSYISVEFFRENEIGWGIGIAVSAVVFFIIQPLIFSPYCYIFDNEGVSIRYVFATEERYLWKDIYAIEVEYTDYTPTCRVNIFSFFIFIFGNFFNISGENVNEERFYMKRRIRKSFKTKRLLEKYWDGTITGYVFEDVKKWINKRRTKKQAQVQAEANEEIVTLERKKRAEVRGWLEPYTAQAKQCGLSLKTKYVYINSDFEESNSRPQEGYTYTFVAEISRYNETDEDRIFFVAIDLVYVRFGKNGYRGVENEDAREKLETEMLEALQEIRKIESDF